MRKLFITFSALFVILWSCNEPKTHPTVSNKSFDSAMHAADNLIDSGYVTEALHVAQSAYKNITPLSAENKFYYFNYCNIIYNRRQDYDRCIEIADSMLEFLEEEADHPENAIWKTTAYNSKADALFAKGLYNDAYNYYHLAQVLAVELKDSCAQRTYTYSLAMTLYRQQRFEQAANRFKQAYILAEHCPSDFSIFYFKQEQLDNIGLCYNALKRYDSAMLYYNKALVYLDKMTGKFENKLPSVYEAPKAIVYGNMAEVYMHLEKFDSAKLLYENSIRINLQKGYTNSDALIDQVKLARLYLKTDDIALAKNTLTLIKAELDTIPDKKQAMLWHKLMWQYCEHEKDSLNGYRHLRSYMLENENYINDNKALMQADLDMRVSNLEQKYQINKLVTGKKHQSTYMIIITVFALLVTIIVLLVLREARRSKRNVAQLTDLNNKVYSQKKQLEQTLEQLQAKEKDNSRILKSVAHDVMSPIAAIVSLADILMTDENASLEDRMEILGLIKEASTNSLNLSKDILEAAKEMNDTSNKRERTDIDMLVSKTVELLSFNAMTKKQLIEVTYPTDRIYAYVQEDKIRRVMNNILSNAIKFSHENSTIKVVLEEKNNNVHISVTDTGIGIPEKNKPFVFDMFTDAKMKGTDGEIPHGLGLSISQQIIKAHHGDIWFESEEGKGTTFHISFPVKP